MRRVRIALAACALAVAPLALSAQTSAPSHAHHPVRPHPRPTGGHPGYPHPGPSHPGYPHGNVNRPGYPAVIDGSVVDRYVNAPTPKPHATRKPQRTDHSFGQQTFETHATDGNR